MFHQRSNPFLQRKNPIDIYKVCSPSKIQYGKHFSPPYTTPKLSSVYQKQAQEQLICNKIMKRYERTLYETDERGHCLASELIIQKLIDGEKDQEFELQKILKENRLNRQNQYRQSSRVDSILSKDYHLKSKQTELRELGVKMSKTRHILNNYKDKRQEQKFSLENIYRSKGLAKNNNEKKVLEQEHLITFINFKEFDVQQTKIMNQNINIMSNNKSYINISSNLQQQPQMPQFQSQKTSNFPPNSISISNITYYLIS